MGQCISLISRVCAGEGLSSFAECVGDTPCEKSTQNLVEFHPFFQAEFAATDHGKQMAIKRLAKFPLGTFFLRRSATNPDHYTMMIRTKKGYGTYPGITFDKNSGSIRWKNEFFNSLDELKNYFAENGKYTLSYPVVWLQDLGKSFDSRIKDNTDLYNRFDKCLDTDPELLAHIVIPSSKSSSGLSLIYSDNIVGVLKEEIEYDQETESFIINRGSQKVKAASLPELIDQAIPNSHSLKQLEESISKVLLK